MVEMLPFRGVRYARTLAQPAVFAPPYDVISEALRQQYTARSAYNITHVDVTPSGANTEWYSSAATQLQAWLESGILERDNTPAYYGYVQHFTLADKSNANRCGLFASVRLAPWGKGIYRHEHTRAAPRADRLNLMRATRAQLSPVFGMVSDPQLALANWLQPPQAAPVDYLDDGGTRQVFWPIDDTAYVAAIQAFLADKEIVIADGHHRYETALAYRDERRTVEGNPGQAQPYDYVLMYITAVEDPGLRILPTHRVITTSRMPELAVLREQLGNRFQVQEVHSEESLESIIRPLGESGTAIGICLPDGMRWLCQREHMAGSTSAEARAAGQAEYLDVNILLNDILAPCFGIDADVLKAAESVYYTISEAEARALVDSGKAQAAFILNPTSLRQVWESAHRLETMPQKSTYFYPKLLTGLVIHTL